MEKVKSYYKDKKLMKRFGENLERLRKEKDMSQEELAEMLKLSQPYIAKIESGNINTSISHANALAKALKVPINYLFE